MRFCWPVSILMLSDDVREIKLNIVGIVFYFSSILSYGMEGLVDNMQYPKNLTNSETSVPPWCHSAVD